MTIDTNKISPLTKYWCLVAAYLIAGWVLTGLDMPEARATFVVLVGRVIGIGLIFLGMFAFDEQEKWKWSKEANL